MITPVNPLRTKLISPSYSTHQPELLDNSSFVWNYSRMETVHCLEFKSNVLCKSIPSKKTFHLTFHFIQKYNCRRQLGLGLPDHFNFFKDSLSFCDYWNYTLCLHLILFSYTGVAHFLNKHCWVIMGRYFLLHNCLRWNKSTRYSVQLHCLI